MDTSGGGRRSRIGGEIFMLHENFYPKEWGKTALAMLLLFVASLGNGMVIAYIHQLIDDRKPLDDIVFRLVPHQRWAWTAADAMVTFCGLFCLLIGSFHKHNSIVLRRTNLLAAVLYVLRASFLLCTYLPPPFPDAEERCLPRWNISSDPAQFFIQASRIVFTVGFSGSTNRILCGDTIYSGHTMIYFLAGMVIWNYCPKPWRPLVPVLIVIAVAFGLVAVIVSRQHYTIDVAVGSLASVSVYYGYHVWCGQPRRRLTCVNPKSALQAIFRRKDNRFGRIRFSPIYSLFLYFEGRVPRGDLPHDLAWPLPWPKKMVSLFENWNYASANVDVVANSGQRREV